ncbi:8-oxoguanine glycosylase ogg1, partial [Halocaridina rubra]
MERAKKAKRFKRDPLMPNEHRSNCIGEEKEKKDTILKDYFQLGVPLAEMYTKWSKADRNFAAVSPHFPGVRMLNQDPVENVFSFICSSNNNIQ